LLSSIDEIGYFTFSNNSDVVPPSEARPNSIFVSDDVACDKQDTVREYFTMSRRSRVDCFYLCQSYARIPKHLIREICHQSYARIPKHLIRTVYARIPKHLIREICHLAHRQRKSVNPIQVGWYQPEARVQWSREYRHVIWGFQWIMPQLLAAKVWIPGDRQG